MTQPGTPVRLAPGVRCILAPNPSPMTYHGTNTYLVGEGRVTVIDPGPALADHLGAILGALGPGEKVDRIVVTHSHLDHSALARPLAQATGAPVLAFGPTGAGDRPATGARAALAGGGEGRDGVFMPDERLPDGTFIDTDEPIEVLHTPGHFGNHICLRWKDMLFTGDHVMGWSTSLVSPPDGDMADYMASLRRIGKLCVARMFPGHGAPIETPAQRVADLIAHRQSREAAILAALAEGPASPEELVRMIYGELQPGLQRAAERSVLAHLLDLCDHNRVSNPQEHHRSAAYRII